MGRKSTLPARPDAIALLLALLFLALAFSSARQKSLTWDEPSYISAGYLALTRGDFRYNPSHPPLMQELAALPLLSLGLRVPPEDFPHWERTGNPVVAFGEQFLYRSGNDPERIAARARVPSLLLGAGLVLAAYLWGRRLFGPAAALLGTGLVAFSPNLLAHASLATEDLGCTALMFAAVWAFWTAMRSLRPRDWIVGGAVTGLALLAKYTALLLAPIYVTIAVARWGMGLPGARSRRVPAAFAVIAAVAGLVVGAGYGFTFDLSLYLDGLSRIYTDLRPDYHYYLLGTISTEGRWYYHPLAFLMKVPVSTLVLLAVAAGFAARDRARREAVLFLLVPPAVVVIASLFDSASFGLRRILPAFPFLFVFAGFALADRRPRPVVALVIVLAALTGLETLRIHPHYLSYFNVGVGGPANGPDLLDDSNLDWGQDLPALANWQRAHPEAGELRISYFGTAYPSAYGVRAVPMEREEIASPLPGTYAISAHRLVWFRKLALTTGQDLDWLTKYEPIDRAGWSIWIYRFGPGTPGNPTPPGS